MNYKVVRTAVAAVLFVAAGVFIAANVTAGTWCGVGWQDMAILCPVGALLTMVASKTIIPRAVISLVVVAVLVFLLGRAFCGWACPVPLWQRIMQFFRPVKKRQADEEALTEANQAEAIQEIAAAEKAVATTSGATAPAEAGEGATAAASGHACASCGACGKKNAAFDSRHAVLGGAVLTTAVFGFPVFCLICPVGLSFAAIALVIALFGNGDLNWSLLFVPAVLVIELVFLRKWCSRFCPISAMMSLVGRFSRTGMPVIDNQKCMETSKGVACSRCATVCTYDVNLRHPNLGELPLHDCARCGDCINACPTQAISLKPVSGKPQPFIDAFASVRGKKNGEPETSGLELQKD